VFTPISDIALQYYTCKVEKVNCTSVILLLILQISQHVVKYGVNYIIQLYSAFETPVII